MKINGIKGLYSLLKNSISTLNSTAL